MYEASPRARTGEDPSCPRAVAYGATARKDRLHIERNGAGRVVGGVEEGDGCDVRDGRLLLRNDQHVIICFMALSSKHWGIDRVINLGGKNTETQSVHVHTYK